MRASVAVIVVALFAAVVVSAPVPKALKAKRPDREVFVGDWETVVAESNGSPMTKAVWTFDAEMTMRSRPLDPAHTWNSEWVIKLGPEKSPKEIDIGEGYKGIYEIDGDEIRIVYAGSHRPINFQDKQKVCYTVLRRVKK